MSATGGTGYIQVTRRTSHRAHLEGLSGQKQAGLDSMGFMILRPYINHILSVVSLYSSVKWGSSYLNFVRLL